MSQPSKSAKDIFLMALDVAPSGRAALLDVECGEDAALRQQVEALLKVHDEPDSLLDSPRIDVGISGVATPENSLTIAQPITEKPGTQIGPYKLLQQIGEGGMGVVYMAEQKEPLKRRVALKIIKAGMDTRQVIARFEAERQTLAMMDHPNIAKVLDAGQTESGRPYFVMELVNGLPVTKYCDEQHLDPKERLELFVPICKAAQHAHQKGIIHRDLKPSNILVALYDGQAVPKIIDFGVAKATSQTLTEKTMFTELGQVVGTLEYMSPEQAERNQLDIDTRSDIYSLGVVLYELLTGDTPFDTQRLRSAAFDEMLRIIREEEPPRPSARLSSSHTLPSVAANRKVEPARLRSLVRGELDWIVMKALEKDRGRRFETASSFAEDIQRHLDGTAVLACPPSATYMFRKFVKRNKGQLTVALILAFAILLAVGSIGWTVRDRASRAEVAEYEKESRRKRLADRVAFVLDEVTRLIKIHKWKEAFEAAKQANSFVAERDVDDESRARAHRTFRVLTLVHRLDAARLRAISEFDYVKREFKHSKADEAYATAFSAYGLDLAGISEGNAATQLIAAAAKLDDSGSLLAFIAAALDDWSDIRRQDAARTAESWQRLATIAELVDMDPIRRRLRVLLKEKVLREEQAANELGNELTALATSEDLTSQPRATVARIVSALQDVGFKEKAVEILSRAQQAHPDDFWFNFLLATNLHVTDLQDPDAIRFLSSALALRPDNANVWGVLGAMLRHMNRLDESIECHQRAIAIDPKHAPSHIDLGVAFQRRGKLDDAIACYRRAIEIEPRFSPSYHNLGFVLQRQGKVDEAIACYRKAIKLDPKRAAHYAGLGSALAKKGNVKAAMETYDRGISLAPEDPELHDNRGVALATQGDLAAAITGFRLAIKFDPEYDRAHMNLGIALAKQGDTDDGIRHLQQAIKMNPARFMAHRNLGYLQLRKGRFDEAIVAFRKYLKIGPPSRAVATTLAGLLTYPANRSESDYAEALKLAKSCVQPSAGPREWQVLGWAYYRNRKWRDSITALEKAIELFGNGGNPLQWLVLAMAHFQVNEKEKARAWFDKSVSFIQQHDPKFPEVAAFRLEAKMLLETVSKKTEGGARKSPSTKR